MGGPGPKEKMCGHSKSRIGLWPLPTLPRGRGPSYLGGPIAMKQDRKGVVSQVPRSHVAHFKLEHDLI